MCLKHCRKFIEEAVNSVTYQRRLGEYIWIFGDVSHYKYSKYFGELAKPLVRCPRRLKFNQSL